MPRRKAPVWPVWLIFIGATALMTVPLPDAMTPFRPPWATMALIYWIMMWPRVFGLGTAWLVGLTLDVLQGELQRLDQLGVRLIGAADMVALQRRNQAWQESSSPSPRVAKNSKQ